MKRQVREAYRLQRQILADKIADCHSMVLAFIWLDDKLYPTEVVMQKVKNLLQRISEKL